MRILLVDDDPDMLALVAHHLAPLGEVVSCDDGLGAIETFRRALEDGVPFQLVCLDLRMQGVTGQQVLLAVRRHEQAARVPSTARARILMTTAVAERAHVQRAAAAGVDGYLLKPFTREELLARIAAVGLPVGRREPEAAAS
jgi:two-component system chemotaxis response regulator CheY